MKNVLEKLQDVLSAEDLKSLESGINALVKDEKEKIELVAEEYTKKQVAEQLEEKKKELIKEYDEKLKKLETTLVEKVDQFIDSEISSQINEDTIKKIGVNESLKPVLDDIISVLETRYVSPDLEGAKLVREAKEELENTKEEASKAIAEKIEMNEKLQEAEVKLLIVEKTSDLTEKEKERVVEFFGDKDLEEVKTKIDGFLKIVKEGQNVDEDDNDDLVNEDVVSEDDGIEDDKEEDKKEDKVEISETMKQAASFM